jgi:indolepyruvate ferredoxin oxidoreductase beta subunit
MKNNLKPKFHEMNLKAIESGYKSIKGWMFIYYLN